MVKKVAILGSTGSIGKNALRVISALGENYQVEVLTAHSKIELLADQVRKYRPKFAAITNKDLAGRFREIIKDTKTQILVGDEGLVAAASMDNIDIVITAVVGAVGLSAVLAAAKKGKRLAIANKEPLVIAGELLMKTAKSSGSEIIPVDSEHSAIFQAMQAGKREDIDKIILTSSGGPFRKASLEDLKNVTLEQALAHPVWNMGPKITIDSATMMNKSLEVIEARWLFEINPEKIEVLIHPQSIIHSLVEFVDGSMIAQLGTPDMCLPIQYALTYPSRVKGISEKLSLDEIGRLTFEKPDLKKFRALALGFEAARVGGTSTAVFNAANEAAVKEFMDGRIKFLNIVELIERCLDKHDVKTNASLEELLEADRWARMEIERHICTV